MTEMGRQVHLGYRWIVAGSLPIPHTILQARLCLVKGQPQNLSLRLVFTASENPEA